MRPYAMTADRGLQPDQTVSLYAKRDTTTSGGNRWRLAWWDGSSDSFCYAEGECSARHFSTARDALAYGARAYRETGKIWPRSQYV